MRFDYILISAICVALGLCFGWCVMLSNENNNKYDIKYCIELSLDKDITFDECMERMEKGK
jgi:hypothetical protein